MSAPLLDWPERREIERIAAARATLMQRIAALKPHEHRLLELRGELKALTARQLELEAKVSA